MTVSILKIRNFQSHKNTQIKFSKGINLICGKTDSGKSSIRRALEWVIKNKPSGDSFRSHWGGQTCVEIEIDKKKIKRIKGNNKNEYFLNKNKYKAFGQNTPESISKAINIDSINIQKQFDPIFLFSKSPGEIARYLNETIDIDVIDNTQSNILREIKKESGEIERQRQEKIKLKEELKSFKWIGKAEKRIFKVEKLKEEIQKTKEFVALIQETLIKIEDIKIEKEKIVRTVNFEFKIKGLIKDWLQVEERKKQIENIRQELNQTYLFLTDKKIVKNRLKKNSNILNLALKNNCPLCGRRKI